MPHYQVFQFSGTWPGSQKAKPEARAYILLLYWELESQRSTRRAKGGKKGKEGIAGWAVWGRLPFHKE